MHKPLYINYVRQMPLSTLSPEQVAELLDVSVATVYNYSSKGKSIGNDIKVKLQRGQDKRYTPPLVADFLQKIM